MDYQELQSAVFDAYRRREYPACFSLLDGFIESSEGVQLGQALRLKASMILVIDYSRVPEGLTLVDRALDLLERASADTGRALVTALALCYAAGDVARARRYETLGNQLLTQHGGNRVVQELQYKFHANLGMIATLRGEHASAYWHFVQGSSLLKSFADSDSTESRNGLFSLHIQTARACIQMSRTPEAEEALRQAEQYIGSETQRVKWIIGRCEVLRCSSRPQEAAQVLAEAAGEPKDSWDPETRAQFCIARALVAQDLGDLHTYHEAVHLAQKVAVTHSLDWLLSRIQRIQRASGE